MKKLTHSQSVVSRLSKFAMSVLFFSGMFFSVAQAEEGVPVSPEASSSFATTPESAIIEIEIEETEAADVEPTLEIIEVTTIETNAENVDDEEVQVGAAISEPANITVSEPEPAEDFETDETALNEEISTDIEEAVGDDEVVEVESDVVTMTPEVELVQTIFDGETVTEELIIDGEKVAESVVVTILDGDVEVTEVEIEVTDDIENNERVLIDIEPMFLIADVSSSDDAPELANDTDFLDDALEQVSPTTSALAPEDDADFALTLDDVDTDEENLDEDAEEGENSGGNNVGIESNKSSDRHFGLPDGTFRVTEYYVTIDDFSGTTYDLVLDYDLANDYFILVRGSRTGSGKSYPDNDYVRIYRVPEGRGDLADSGANNVVSLSRHVADYDWEGVVTVVESLTDAHASGFRLLDVVETSVVDDATFGSDNSVTPWDDVGQVVLFGGYRGGGAEFEEDAKNSRQGDVVYTRLYPSGSDTLNWERVDNGGQSLGSMTMTTFVVEWGAQWQVQHALVSGTKAGQSADKTKHYTTVAIDPVTRRNTWVWGTGTSTGDGIGEDSEATLIALGDGVNQNELETSVAMGSKMSAQRDFDIYTMTHLDLATDYVFKSNGDQQILDLNLPTDSAPAGSSMAAVYSACASASSNHPQCRFWSRYIYDDWITISRGYRGKKFAAWVQGVDFSQIKPTVLQGVVVDIVDALSQSISNPMVVMDDVSFSFANETSSGVLGVADQRIRLSNSGLVMTWSVSIAPTSGAAALWWDGGANTFDFEDSLAGGQLTVDPSVATVSRPDGGSIGGVTLGSAESFAAGVRDEVLLYSAAGAEPHQEYDLMGVALFQIIPALQVEGDYKLQLTLTAI